MTTEEPLAKAEHESVEVECTFCHHILKIAPQDLPGVLMCPACGKLIEVEPDANHPTLRFDCPECGSPLEVSLHGSRERVKCPHCACDVRPPYAELFWEKKRWWIMVVLPTFVSQVSIMVGLPTFVSQVRRAWTQYRERRRAERAARQMHLEAQEAERAARQMHLEAQEAERAARQMHLEAQEAERYRCPVAQQRHRAIQLNTSQRLVVVVGVLTLMAMCAYPPHSGSYEPHYDWLWEPRPIDTARLGLQLLLVAGATGLLAYGLRPAAIQALAKRKKLLAVSVVVAVTVGAAICAVGAGWEDLYWWWYRLPPEQVSKITVAAEPPWEPPSDAISLDPTAPGATAIAAAEPPWEPSDPFIEPPQQQRLVVANGSGEALQAISIRIYYPKILLTEPKLLTDEEVLGLPSTAPPETSYHRLPCRVLPGGQTVVTVYIEHYYTLPLRVEVVEAWRQ